MPKIAPVFCGEFCAKVGKVVAVLCPKFAPEVSQKYGRISRRSHGSIPEESPRILRPPFARKFCAGGIIVPEVDEVHAGYAHVLRAQIVLHGRLQAMCRIKPYGAFYGPILHAWHNCMRITCETCRNALYIYNR